MSRIDLSRSSKGLMQRMEAMIRATLPRQAQVTRTEGSSVWVRFLGDTAGSPEAKFPSTVAGVPVATMGWVITLGGKKGLFVATGVPISTGGGAVNSVNGQIGSVVLNADHIDDTSTSRKYVSAADLTKLSNLSGVNTGDQDLSGKVDKTTTVNGKPLSGNVTLAKGDVGLGNVDNTSDAAKPVSTATQTALNGKANSTHTHTISQVTSLQTSLDAKLNTSEVSASATSGAVVRRTGAQIIVPATPTANTHAASKGYVDAQSALPSITTSTDIVLSEGVVMAYPPPSINEVRRMAGVFIEWTYHLVSFGWDTSESVLIATLPVGFRPATTKYGLLNAGSSGYWVEILPNGEVHTTSMLETLSATGELLGSILITV